MHTELNFGVRIMASPSRVRCCVLERVVKKNLDRHSLSHSIE